MAIQVKAPGKSGGWFWVKRDIGGRLRFSIYETEALPDTELNKCKTEYPILEFRTERLRS